MNLLHRSMPILLLVAFLFFSGGVIAVSGGHPVTYASRLLHHTPKPPSRTDIQLIDIDGAARRGTPLTQVNDIVVHYVGNPGTTAQQNRDYFNQEGVTVSAHFVIGLDGEIIQCIPLDEKSSASNERNNDTISIEVCHPDETGQFTHESYDSLVYLCAWLCDSFGLDRSHIIRHYDITGKACPLFYTEHEDAWEQLKSDILWAEI